MNKTKLLIYTFFSVFLVYMLYILISSLRPPDHIHSRDDVPQQASSLQAQKAIEELQSRLKDDSGNTSLWLQLGHIYLEQRSFDNAATVFRNATKIDPGNAEALVDMGIALNALKKTDDALRIFKQATEKFPDYGEGWLRLGLLYRFRLNDNARAMKFLEKYLSIAPESEVTSKVKNELEQIKSEL